jgi:hypothetical protein
MRMPDSVNDREVVRCIRFRRFEKNTLLAFVDLELWLLMRASPRRQAPDPLHRIPE